MLQKSRHNHPLSALLLGAVILQGCTHDPVVESELITVRIANESDDTLFVAPAQPTLRPTATAGTLSDAPPETARRLDPHAIVAFAPARIRERPSDSLAISIYSAQRTGNTLLGNRAYSLETLRQHGYRIHLTTGELALAVAAQADTSPRMLFESTDSLAPLPDAPSQRLARLRVTKPWAIGLRTVRLRTDARARLQRNTPIDFELEPGSRLRLIGDRAVDNARNARSWHGSDGRSASAQIVMTELGVSGHVLTGGAAYELEPLGDGLHALYRVNYARLPADGSGDILEPTPLPSYFTTPRDSEVIEPGTPRLSSAPLGTVAAAIRSAGVSLAPGTDVDNGGSYQKVLVVYTQNAGVYDQYGTALLAVNTANQVYRNNSLYMTLLLAGVGTTTFDEATHTWPVLLTYLEGTSDGSMDDVHTQRANVKADLVMLVTAPEASWDVCGASVTVLPTRERAFSFVKSTCMNLAGSWAFVHEIGHLQGANHDVGASSQPPGGFSYGKGYVDPNRQWRTMMAYSTVCPNGVCPRVQYISDPSTMYPATGQYLGVSGAANNALALTTTAPYVRDFFAPSPPASFTQLTFYGGQRPKFSWPAVSGATNYTVFRCESSQTYCGSVSFAYTNSGSTWQVEDMTRTLTGAWPPCAKSARYYVRAYSYDGVSPESSQQYVVCLQ